MAGLGHGYWSAMPTAKPEWVFTRTANRTWAWRAIPRNGGIGDTGDAFSHLDAATADAVKKGFDPFAQYWIVRLDGNTIHYRPRQPPLYANSDGTPKN